MLGSYKIRTDLAVEARERFTEENVEVRGVEVREEYNEEKEIRTTVVKITTENGARSMGRPQGTYITIESEGLSARMKIITERYRRSCQASAPADRTGEREICAGCRAWKPGDYSGLSGA